MFTTGSNVRKVQVQQVHCPRSQELREVAYAWPGTILAPAINSTTKVLKKMIKNLFYNNKGNQMKLI